MTNLSIDRRTLLGSLRVFTLAESLGGVESLISHPVTMTHAAMSPQARAAAGIGDSLLRLSVGLEAAEDLMADLGQGFANIAARRSARQGAQGNARST